MAANPATGSVVGMTLDRAAVAALPKVLLHDHLDGGLRPATVVELAAEVGHTLPVDGAEALAEWFWTAANGGSLETYLETFDHTLAVMQTADGLRRVAREAAIDLAADGVVHAEVRYAPELHLAGGLDLQGVVDAVQDGFAEGVALAASHGQTIRIGTILTAMRQNDHWERTARLALENRDRGVVAVDLAGPEDGFPATRHPEAFRALREASFPVTIHAGEGAGLDSIAGALHGAFALRLGHGVRIVDDVDVDVERDEVRLGRLAHWVRDQQVVLEVCPSSNVQTGLVESVAEHPVTLLRDLGFAVTVSTDNRLQSRTSLSRELSLLVEEAGWTLDDVRAVTLDAAWNIFCHHDERTRLVEDVILPAYDAAARTAGAGTTHPTPEELP